MARPAWPARPEKDKGDRRDRGKRRDLQETTRGRPEAGERRKANLGAGGGIRAKGRAAFAALLQGLAWHGAERPGGGPVFGHVWHTFDIQLL